MKSKTIFDRTLAIFLSSLFVISSPATSSAATSSSVLISDVQIEGIKADDEYVRLTNETDTAIDLTGFRLTKKISSKGVCKESALVSAKHFIGIIPPHGSFFIAHPDYKVSSLANLDYSSASYFLSANTTVLLYDKEGGLIDTKTIGTACTDEIIEVVSAPGTPLPSSPLETAARPSVRLNEIFPNPKAKGDAGEFIELFNSDAEEADISGWILRDATKTGKYIFPVGTRIASGAYLVITDQSFKLALNNSHETISLFDASGILIDSVRYEKTKEDVSLNYTTSGWRGGTPTPGTENILNNLPETSEKVPKKGSRGVPVEFQARGKDSDGDILRYTWDFGDGHKSYKEKTSHVYEKNGKYTVTLKTTDGNDDTIEIFTIDIRSLEYPKISITALMPNPEGNDTDHEWITIENLEKKSINLQGFSIATGWKNLVNHPIREDFVIKSKQKRELTRDHSLFTLPNQKGKLELRAPDGEVLQKIKYKLEKSVADNMVYQKEKGKTWEWKKESPDRATSLPLDTKEDSDAVSDEKTFLPEITKDTEEKIPVIAMSRAEKTPPRLLNLLSYGTKVKVSEDISFAFEETLPDTDPSQEHYAISFAKESLASLNSALNALLGDTK